jgi:PAS domain S-box-containing protein
MEEEKIEQTEQLGQLETEIFTDIEPIQAKKPVTLNVDETRGITYDEYLAIKRGFVEERKKMEDRMWLDSNLNRFDEVLRQNYDSSIKKFAESVINYVAKVVGAVYGAFFVVDSEKKEISAVAGYAVMVDTMDRTTFKIGEGLIGQVAKSKEILCLDDIETQLDSSLGRMNACYLVVSPLVFNDNVYGIIELTTLSKLKPRYLILIERISRNVGAALQSLLNNQNTKKLLIESLQQTEEYKAQKAELDRKEGELNAIRQQLKQKEDELVKALQNLQTDAMPMANAQHLEELQSAKTQLTEIQERLKEKEGQLEDLAQQLQAGQQLYTGIDSQTIQNEELELAKQALKSLEEQLQEKEKNLKELLTQKPETFSENEEVALLQNKIQHLEEELAKKAKDVEMAKETLKWKDAEIDRQDEALVERKKEIKTIKDELVIKETEVLKNIEEIVRQGKLIQQQEDVLENLKLELEEHKNRVGTHEDSEEIKAALQEKEQEISVLTQEIETLKNTNQHQAEEIEKLNHKLDDKENELTTLGEKLKEVESSHQNHGEEIKNLKAKLKKKEDELLVSQYLLNQRQDGEGVSYAEFEKLKIDIDHKNKVIQKQEYELRTLRSELEEKVSLVFDSGEVESLKEELRQKEAELAEFKAKVENQPKFTSENEEIAALMTELEQIEQNSRLQTEALGSLKQELYSRESEVENLKTQLQQLAENTANKEDFEKILEELQRKENENLQQAEALSNLRNQLLEKEMKIENLEKSQDAGTVDITEQEKLMQKISDLEQIQQELQNKEQSLVAKAEEIQTKEQSLVAKVEEIQTKEQSLVAKVEEIQTKEQSLVAKVEEIQAKEQEVIAKEQELESIKLSLQSQQQIADNQNESTQNQGGNQLANENMISQYQQMEVRLQELQQKERELAGLFNKINTAFASMEIDMNGSILSINNKFLMLLGKKLEEVENSKYEQLLKPDYFKSPEFKILWEGLRMGVSQNVNELLIVGNKGKEIYMDVTYIPILGDNGKPYEVVKLVNRVLEGKQENVINVVPANVQENSTAGLNTEEKEKIKALENSFAIVDMDLEGNVIRVNKQFLVLLGYDEADLIGKHHRNMIDVTDRSSEEYQNTLYNIMHGGFGSIVLKYVGKEGERVRLRSYFNPIKDENETPLKIMMICQFVN